MNAVALEHKVVTRGEWLEERQVLLAAEKEFTRRRDELAARRRALPWVRLEKNYEFEGPCGAQSLGDLFGPHSQLIVYHFMLGANWEEGCRSCSLLADHFDATLVHLAHRDVAFAVVSHAPQERIAAFRKRMGWHFHWVSAVANEFQSDFGVHFTKEELAGPVTYNFQKGPFFLEEAPGLSVFSKNAAGEVFHTYSTYARGLDMLIGAYQFLDLVPKGRDEEGLAFPMAWVRHHDRYGVGYEVDPKAGYEQPREVNSCCGNPA